MKFDVWKPGDGQPPQGLQENDAAISFEAFQRQAFGEDHGDPVLPGILILPFWLESGLLLGRPLLFIQS